MQRPRDVRRRGDRDRADARRLVQQEQAAPIVDAKLAPLMKAWANLNTGRDLAAILGA